MALQRSRGTSILLAVATTLSLGEQDATAQTVLNWSFEDVVIGPPFVTNNPAAIPGWTHLGTPGDGRLWRIGYSDGSGSITTAGHGSQFVTLGGGFNVFGTGSWTQTLTGLNAGTKYWLSFMMAGEALFSGPQSITVDFPTGSPTSAQTFTSSAPTANYWRNWDTRSMTFIASSNSVDLRFTASTVFDVGLDAVRVQQLSSTVPEPMSMALLGTGLAGVAAARRRRKRKESE